MLADEWITIREASRILGVSKRTVWRRIKAGQYMTLHEEDRKKGDKVPRMVSKSDILRVKEGGERHLPALPQDLADRLGVVTRDALRQYFKENIEELVTNVSHGQKSYFRNYIIITGVVILALVTIAVFYVTRHSDKAEEKIRAVVTTVSQGQEAQNQDQKALKIALMGELVGTREQIRALEAADKQTKRELLEATRTADQAKTKEIQLLRDTVEAQSAGIRTMAEQMKAITAKLEEMNLERKEEPPPGPATIEEKPAPAATVPPAPETEPAEEGSGFLGIF